MTCWHSRRQRKEKAKTRMAKGKKAASREMGRQLDQSTFFRFISGVKTVKQDLDDAAMAHAAEWKKAEPLGIHSAAAKLFAQLDRMEDLKRADFLRAFDRYRNWAAWNAQSDLLETTETAAEVGSADRDYEDEERADHADADASEHTEREPAAVQEPLAEVEADLGEDTAAEATEELAGAGFVFADGKEAALSGQAVETNPHSEGSPSHSIWTRGHAQGLRDKDAAAEAEAQSSVVPLTGGRRSRRADAEAAGH
jgi:hypothetical protein